MAENNVSDGSDFEDVYDDENDTVLDSDGPGEAEDPLDRVMGHDMLVNAMFDDEDDDLSDSRASTWPGSKTAPIFAQFVSRRSG